VVPVRTMGNGLNESRQAASSQDLYTIVSHGSCMWRSGGPWVRPEFSANYRNVPMKERTLCLRGSDETTNSERSTVNGYKKPCLQEEKKNREPWPKYMYSALLCALCPLPVSFGQLISPSLRSGDVPRITITVAVKVVQWRAGLGPCCKG
jgi:hypothetical protein